uniref:Uncharacterized protein n=1 Tax=Zea mays TaxID=4577 RepID=C0PN12_MAIZE|nr:unknown [Zea mays]
MRKLCPNLERDDALDTVLEVPIPEEMFSGGGGSRGSTRFGCTNVKAWMRSHAADRSGAGEPCSMTRGELQLMLGVIGAPLIPLPVYHANQSPCSVLCEQLKADPIESSSAKYIVQQYIAASGGEWALNKVKSMYAMGKVRMTAAELNSSDADGHGGSTGNGHHRGGKKGSKGGGVAPDAVAPVARIPRSPAPAPPFAPGPRSAADREPVRGLGVHRRAEHRRRGLLRAQGGGGGVQPARAQQQQRRDHPAHGVGLLQPAHGPAGAAGGLAPAADQVQRRRRRRERLLGDHHGVPPRRLPRRRRRQHRPRRPHRRLARQVRRLPGRQHQDAHGGGVEHRGGGLQHLGPLHGLLPAAQRPQGGQGEPGRRRRQGRRAPAAAEDTGGHRARRALAGGCRQHGRLGLARREVMTTRHVPYVRTYVLAVLSEEHVFVRDTCVTIRSYMSQDL